ncbi:thiamine-binding protein [Xylanibacillus composti]|uniref:UPF0045 protein YqgV n=1 Tax=Xylanibacillus composti TaxID=1572762 RepID=A0A8J4H1A4_9BACL|nr:MTH1187 family thiamine-binding protein [Xylanibacillus composti]MDT9725661.1 thiamine-binding protein [Xylanibacillus composti]GIQ67756.1 UPF0045 protein YqgV [Xylanibacillus composti]
MAIADITIIPVGTGSPSVSEYVADIHKLLEEKKLERSIKVLLTPMSTLLEGELSDLLAVIHEIHELPFQKGASRVCTNIRIDDRRDKPLHMEDKVRKVEERLRPS